MCLIPFWLVLVYTGYADSAVGFSPQGSSFWWYFPVSALIVGCSFLLNWIRGYLVLRFSKVDCGLAESARLLCGTHALMALLEAAATLALFFLRHTGEYSVLEQLQLFGHEQLFAARMAGVAYVKGATATRCAITGVVCFLLSSAWLMLSVLSGMF